MTINVSVLGRYTGHGDGIVARWLTRTGEHRAGLYNVFFRHLVIASVQFDELYTQVHITGFESRARSQKPLFPVEWKGLRKGWA